MELCLHLSCGTFMLLLLDWDTEDCDLLRLFIIGVLVKRVVLVEHVLRLNAQVPFVSIVVVLRRRIGRLSVHLYPYFN